MTSAATQRARRARIRLANPIVDKRGKYYRPPMAERLSARLVIDPATGCHNWTGSQMYNGYGQIRPGDGRGALRVHRAAYELANGPIPDGMQIDHLCRNRLCCNPDHLEAVTREENIARGNAPHMVNARKTHCKYGHEFSPENTLVTKRGSRSCRQCAAASSAAKRAQTRPETQ